MYEVKCKTAGLPGDGGMVFSTAIVRCGDIEDGIGIDVPDHIRGGWVISFADLERVYTAAVAARFDHAPKDNERAEGQAASPEG